MRKSNTKRRDGEDGGDIVDVDGAIFLKNLK